MKSVRQPPLRMTALLAFSVFAATAYSQVVKKSEAIPTENAPAKPAATAESEDDELTVLSPFEVSAAQDKGYQATQTLAGTRIRTDLKDVGSAISVYTKDFMRDIGATDNKTLLQYTTNAEVGGTRGSYAGLGNATSVDEIGQLRAPAGAQRVRGLASADNTRDFFVTDIPWDSYNVDRIDIQRGPNAILFGLGSPAGIINASLHNAEFRNSGSVNLRVGSFGSKRGSIDINQQIIPKMLSIRVDGLKNNEKFQQKQAFQDDKRISGAIRFDPNLFKDQGFKTSLKVKFEHGEIDANRPRIVPPADSITPWFRDIDNTSLVGGMGKVTIDNAYLVGANPGSISPWLTAGIANQQQPIWFVDGTSGQTYRIYGGYVNTGAMSNTGTNRGAGNSIIGQRYSDEFYGLTSLSSFATNAKVPGYEYGQFRQMSLRDPTIFDFYHNLIDGPTKSEFEKWNTQNIDLSQTAFDDRLGVELTYDRQKYKRGGQSLLGNPTLTIDILKNFQDMTANPNFGRPYIVGGPGNGNSYESDRKYKRASLFGELRARDFFQNAFLVKLLGKQRFNGVYSDESYVTENRSWQMYAHSQAWAGYWNQTTGANSSYKDRPPVSAIYLGSSLANASSARGAGISGIIAPVTLADGNPYHFASTWTGPAGTWGNAWTGPTGNQTTIYDTTPPTGGWTQASNPANYVGWNTNFQDTLLRYNNGADPSLTTVAQKSMRVTKSYAGSWQGYMWNDAIVPNLGWRYDEVKGKSVTAAPVTGNRSMLNLSPDAYRLPDAYPANQIFKNHSTAGGLVVHMNKLFGSKDPLPFNISLSYNKSSNFQVTDTRRDVFGKAIDNPTGATKDFGVLLSTKDGKYSFRVVRYETSVTGANTPLDLTGLAGVITQGIKFRNVFLYRMSGYTWDTREQTNLTAGQRFFWTPAYVNAAGRPVADLNGAPTPIPAGATLETQAQADQHRDASIRAWNGIQTFLAGKGFFSGWNYAPTTLSALTDRATYEATLGPNTTSEGSPARLIPVQNNAALVPDVSTLASYSATAPSGLAVTADTESKGYEFELTANPLPNWRLSFNASQTTAKRTNVGGAELDALIAYMDAQIAGVAGDMRQFNGNYVSGNEVRQNYANWRGQYTLLKLQEGSAASELRKWRYNVVSNYSFTRGWMKGVGVGASYRWQDKVVIGYPVLPNGALSTFDLSKPYYGPVEEAGDVWLSYERKLSTKINWKIQLNVRNLLKKNGLIPISVEPDGQTWAAARVKPIQEWNLTNTFSF